MQQIGVSAGSHQTAYQRVFKHITAAAGVFADDDPGRTVSTAAALQLGIIPAQKTADFKGMVSSQVAVGFSPEAVGSEIFTHRRDSFQTFFTTVPLFFQMLLSGTMPRTQEVG